MNTEQQALVSASLKGPDQARLMSLGLSDMAISELAELVVEARENAEVISTPSAWRKGMDGLPRPMASIEAALKACDAQTRDLIDAAIAKTVTPRSGRMFTVNELLEEIGILATSVRRIRDSSQVKRPGPYAGLRLSVKSRVCAILAAHGIVTDERPKGPTHIALEIVLDAAGMKAADVRNFLRSKASRAAGK